MDDLHDKRRLKFAERPRILDRKSENSENRGEEKPKTDSPPKDVPKEVPDTQKTPGKRTKDEKPDGKPYQDPMSDDDRALINVWMQSEEEGLQDAEATSGDYDVKFEETSRRFNRYRHHYFEDGEWKLYSDNDKTCDRMDEEWFLPTPTAVLDENDPEYLCEMCRHIDFGTLLTQRGLSGNNNPGPCVIELKAVSRILDDDGRCAFCSLVREAMRDRCTSEEIDAVRGTKDGRMRLSVLDDGPEYALRLEVELAGLVPRVVVQMLAPEMDTLPLRGLPVGQAADMERLGGWIRTCEQHHGAVSSAASISELSALRVIDVDEDRVVTVDTPCRYACLSYVWGKDVGTQLTSETRPILESPGGLTGPPMRLGQTLQDAIAVTRAIGLRYLWIDALCILQDDDKDKAEIISQMSAIYGNAVITIVASTNSCPAQGLPGVDEMPRSRVQIVKKTQGISLAVAFHDARLPYGDIEDSLWNSRAWTFQERHLSPRAVYFTGSQMYFTCPHEVIFEDTVPGLSAPTPLTDQSRFDARVYPLMMYIWRDPTQTRFPNKTFHIHGLGSKSVSMMTDDDSIPAPIYRASPAPSHGGGTWKVRGETLWKSYSDAVGMYTRRRMTWQTDALHAFQGVTDLLARGVNTAFWHGLPEFAFDQALLWYPREPLKRRVYDGASPSWSWAGWEGHTGYRGRGWRNAIALPPVNVVRWLRRRDPRELIREFIVSDDKHSPEEIAEYAYRVAREPAPLRALHPADLYHLDRDDDDGWVHCRDTDRNEHYYTHEAYPGLRFTYPASLPSQSILPRVSPQGSLFFVARTVSARFVDMSVTPHNPTLGVDSFLQLGLNDAARSAPGTRRAWQHVIYHQGYRAGFLSLHIPFSSPDTPSEKSDDKTVRESPDMEYILVAMSRDTIPHIAPPLAGWDAYWGIDPREAQRQVLYRWEWGSEPPHLGPESSDSEPYQGRVVENGDPHWDAVRFGNPTVLDVYNVLLLKKTKGEEGAWWWERVGVGKVNAFAFLRAGPEEQLVMIR